MRGLRRLLAFAAAAFFSCPWFETRLELPDFNAEYGRHIIVRENALVRRDPPSHWQISAYASNQIRAINAVLQVGGTERFRTFESRESVANAGTIGA